MKDLRRRLRLDLMVEFIKMGTTQVSLLHVLFWLTVALQSVGFRYDTPLKPAIHLWPPAGLPSGHWLRYGTAMLVILALFFICFRFLLDRRRAASSGSAPRGAVPAGWAALRPHLFALAVAVTVSLASIAASRWAFDALDPLPDRQIAGVVLAEAGPPGDIPYETMRTLLRYFCLADAPQEEGAKQRCEVWNEHPGLRARMFNDIFLEYTFGRAAPAMVLFHTHLIFMMIVYVAVCRRLSAAARRSGEGAQS